MKSNERINRQRRAVPDGHSGLKRTQRHGYLVTLPPESTMILDFYRGQQKWVTPRDLNYHGK